MNVNWYHTLDPDLYGLTKDREGFERDLLTAVQLPSARRGLILVRLRHRRTGLDAFLHHSGPLLVAAPVAAHAERIGQFSIGCMRQILLCGRTVGQ